MRMTCTFISYIFVIDHDCIYIVPTLEMHAELHTDPNFGEKNLDIISGKLFSNDVIMFEYRQLALEVYMPFSTTYWSDKSF